MGTVDPTRPPKTPRPTNGGERTPRPTPDRTPRPTTWSPPKTTKPPKTPRPTRDTDRTPKPTRPDRTPKPTKGQKTPRPTAWSPPKTTKPPKTPRPTATYLRTPEPTRTPKPTHPPKTPKPTNPPKTPRPTQTYLQPTPRPTVGGGWGPVKTTEAPNRPLSGCAVELSKNGCKGIEGCAWKEGYPPLEFSEDSDYVLYEEGDESFFAVNGSVVRGALNMDYKVMIGVGLLIAAVLVYAFRQYSMKKEKMVIASEATALLA